ncbi:MAG: hypothetical protein Tsb0016_16330 [Sphingomonadales bacterium]
MGADESDIGANSALTVPERELRIALVCYGGVSLAVYMHGITKEILKLVRASKRYHAIRGEDARSAASPQASTQAADETDSEPVYFELLQMLGKAVDLRVVVDIIAGASAGGINGVMLARALAYNLSLDAHRKLWLELADVTELLDPLGRAGLWSKPYMRPALSLMGWLFSRRETRYFGAAARDAEVRGKLSLFTRSRWFYPPFSGERMCEMMLDGAATLGSADNPDDSLLPPGIALDLFVTTTDFWGHRQTITLHDPPQIREREHRHILRFRHLRRPSGDVVSGFGDDHVPSLAFAARATSCFPGAFPAARFAEMDRVLRRRNQGWRGRDLFMRDNFEVLRQAGEDPEDAAFIDGSVLMNKPFALAIEAVQGRPAHREVDRRLVYIEPNPEVRRMVHREVPGFFTMLKAALSDIPRNQPIRDDLEWLESFNGRVRTLRQVVDAIRPNVMTMIADLLGERLNTPPDAARLAAWRHGANERAAHDAAYAYDGYARLKVLSVLQDVAALLCMVIGDDDKIQAEAAIEAWARRQGIRPLGEAAQQAQQGDEVPWIAFLRQFDTRYRVRRLRFVIRRLNQLYRNPEAPVSPAGRHWLNSLKAMLYQHVDIVQRRMEWTGMEPMSQAAVADERGHGLDDASIDMLLQLAASSMDLAQLDDALDSLLAERAALCPDVTLWRELVIAYLGFPYYDVVTFPMAQWRDLQELDDVKVDRISANDANTLREGSARDLLKGVELGNFGAFFSRKFRENDYLWGRLTGAERLVDIVVSAAPEAARMIDVVAIKKKLFLAILEAEKPHLQEVADLIAELRRDAEQL